jgi:hypothetical protein
MYPSFAPISEMETCIQNCMECHSACLAMVSHCLRMGRDHSTPNHISTLLTCAETCQTAANLMLLDSPLQAYMCGVAAAACKRCAEECERLGQEDEQMLACAETCRQCFNACRSMANMTA